MRTNLVRESLGEMSVKSEELQMDDGGAAWKISWVLIITPTRDEALSWVPCYGKQEVLYTCNASLSFVTSMVSFRLYTEVVLMHLITPQFTLPTEEA